MFNGFVRATRQPRESQAKQYEECPPVNGESEQRESKEAVGRLERGIVSSKHMGVNGLPYTGALKVERAVMKLMSDYTKFMLLALQRYDVNREIIYFGLTRKKRLQLNSWYFCLQLLTTFFCVAGFRPGRRGLLRPGSATVIKVKG